MLMLDMTGKDMDLMSNRHELDMHEMLFPVLQGMAAMSIKSKYFINKNI